jgi:hypothetical protein
MEDAIFEIAEVLRGKSSWHQIGAEQARDEKTQIRSWFEAYTSPCPGNCPGVILFVNSSASPLGFTPQEGEEFGAFDRKLVEYHRNSLDAYAQAVLRHKAWIADCEELSKTVEASKARMVNQIIDPIDPYNQLEKLRTWGIN